jgi:hypothetical protein
MYRRRRASVDETRKEDDLNATLVREFLQRIAERLAVDVKVVDSRNIRDVIGKAGRPGQAERQQPE